ncbi:MAG TPA: zf-HC2 domain-containing protein [Armatimonadota bacterium]|nr:zf-HC2 domain-containing protein [Armatimonadota bacterium]
MSCQRVLSLLSAYMDGEVETADADAIARHLAACASCACEYELLRRTTAMLKSTAEIEPPACLLEQIKAATVKRPALRARVYAALGTAGRMPQYVRWTAAGAAAVCVILGVLLLHPGAKQSAPAPTERPVASQPADTQVEVAEVIPAPSAPHTIAPAEIARPTHVSGFPRRAHRWHAKTVAKLPKPHKRVLAAAAKLESGAETEKAAEPKDAGSPDEATLAANAVGPADADSTAEQSAAEARRIKIASAVRDDLEARLKRHAEALESLRAQIAARSGDGKYLGRTAGIEGRKYSVELASIWF